MGILPVRYSLALKAVEPGTLSPERRPWFAVVMVVAGHVIAKGIQERVMVSEKYFRAAVVVCIEQAGKERNDRIDAHDRERRYRKPSASITHGALSGWQRTD